MTYIHCFVHDSLFMRSPIKVVSGSKVLLGKGEKLLE